MVHRTSRFRSTRKYPSKLTEALPRSSSFPKTRAPLGKPPRIWSPRVATRGSISRASRRPGIKWSFTYGRTGTSMRASAGAVSFLTRTTGGLSCTLRRSNDLLKSHVRLPVLGGRARAGVARTALADGRQSTAGGAQQCRQRLGGATRVSERGAVLPLGRALDATRARQHRALLPARTSLA